MKFLAIMHHRELPWPPLPWTCPGCGVVYENHQVTVATAGPRPTATQALRAPTEAEQAAATFLCVGCDFLSVAQPGDA